MTTDLRRHEVIHRATFELRYRRGYTFWDRCGRVTNAILYSENDYDWTLQRSGADSIQLNNEHEGMAFEFGPQKLGLTQEQNLRNHRVMSLSEFAALSDRLASHVVTGLPVDTFSRIGFRVWHLYGVDSHDEMMAASDSLLPLAKLNEFVNDVGRGWDPSFRTTVERKTELITVSLSTFTQNVVLPPAVAALAARDAAAMSKNQKEARLAQLKAQRMLDDFPKFGILLDVDAYIDDPPFPDDLTIHDFVRRAIEGFGEIKNLIFRTVAKK